MHIYSIFLETVKPKGRGTVWHDSERMCIYCTGRSGRVRTGYMWLGSPPKLWPYHAGTLQLATTAFNTRQSLPTGIYFAREPNSLQLRSFEVQPYLTRHCWARSQNCEKRLPAPIFSAPTGRMFMKFDIWTFFENLSRKSRLHSNPIRITGTYMDNSVHVW
jgi:hypothetical protein